MHVQASKKILARALGEEGCLHELFEAQADARPEAKALIAGDRSLTYAELEAEANRLARRILALGGGPGKFAGLYCDRSMRPIVAILACLKTGTAYLPIDPSYPLDRIRHILVETEAVLLLTEDKHLAVAKEAFGGTILNLEAEASRLAEFSPERLTAEESGVSPSDLAYVIYTSGTTGRPKGVMAEHGHVYRFARAFNAVCGTGLEDRIYQGFSLSFDGSVEEIWMAFSNGSALVVPDANTPRFGAELGQFLDAMGVTYFSTVPTLLATIPEAVPSLRLLVVSGEICSADMVNRWATPKLRMLNVYGPTEGTVNTTAAECVPGRPVTIGRALPGYILHIVDEQMRPVAPGEKGELYVGGETIARGYLRQPELSAERFLTIPGATANPTTRFYRTGDLVRLNAEGELEFFGRIDSQVKIRGFRVELAEIESILLENPAIRSATVKLVEKDGLQELAAYVVLHAGVAELDRADLLARLESRVPPYMLPGFLDVLAEFPQLTSGKTDRSRLPPPMMPLLRATAARVAPATERETEVAAIWERVFGIREISVEADFFLDLGGHSLVAARMVTLLREATKRRVTVRDAYQNPTVRRLSAYLDTLPEVREEKETGPTLSRAEAAHRALPAGVRRRTAALQAASLYLLGLLFAWPMGAVFQRGLRWYAGEISVLDLMEFAILLGMALWPALLAFSILAKWTLVGRYKPGRYPLWGGFYFRWWLASRIQNLSGAGALAGTPFMSLYFRLLGAKIGKDCALETAQISIADLVSIGDGTSLGSDTQLLGYRVEDGHLILGSVEIGSRCFVGIHSVLGLNTRMEDESALDDQSLLPDGGVLARGETYRGSPAQSATLSLPGMHASDGAHRHPTLFGLAQYLLMNLLGIVTGLPAFAIFLGLIEIYREHGAIAGAAALIVAVPVGFALYCLFIAGLKRAVLSRARPGVYRMDSAFFLRKWLSDRIMSLSRATLLPLYTTLYLPPWLRLLGAKIGRHAELSSIWAFSPELVDIGPESFFADGSIIGGKRIHRGYFEIGVNRVGRRSFVGNSAILPVGRGLGDGCLLGVQSIPPADCRETPDGTEWLGSPPFALPHRVKVGNFDDSLTFRPTRKLYFQRSIIDGLRIVIPGYIVLSSATLSIAALLAALEHGTATMYAVAPILFLALGLYQSLLVAALKWAVMGTFKPEIKPLWSMYVWANEMVNGVYESVMAPAIAPYLGTPFAPFFFRLLGCRIGRGAFLETTLFSEFDLVNVGDYAALNSGAVIQNHLFEDRVMKSSSLKIGDGCSVGNLGVVLYDSEMESGAILGPLSLLMKGETLARRVRAHGIPCVPIAPDGPETPLAQASLEFHGLTVAGLARRPRKARRDEAVS